MHHVLRGLLKLPERLGGGVGAFLQRHESLGNLARPGSLGFHALVHVLELAGETVHLVDHLGKLRTDPGHAIHPFFHLRRKPVHLHHAGTHRLLHLLDEPLDVERGHGRLIGQPADLPGHDDEALAVFAGLLRLDGRIDREQVRLVGHLRDRGDHHIDVFGPLPDRRQPFREVGRRLFEVGHRLTDARDVFAAGIGHSRRLGRHGCHVVHRAEQFLARHGNLPACHGHLARARAERTDRVFLLAAGRRELLRRGIQVETRLLHLRDDAPQARRHAADVAEQLPRLIAAAHVDRAGEIPRGDAARGRHGPFDPAGEQGGEPAEQAEHPRHAARRQGTARKQRAADAADDVLPRHLHHHGP